MPEFPEVESLRRHLVTRGLVGKVITAAHVERPKAIVAPDVAVFETRLTGRLIKAFDRRGKYLMLRLDGPTLIVHLRMTGKLELVSAGEPPEVLPRVTFALDSGQELRFLDWRALGKLWLVDDAEMVVGKLGPEPLGIEFTADYVERTLQRGTPIKALLLDQAAFAGVGNIYADEALWCASIHPLRPARSLSVQEAARLRACIQEILASCADILERSLNEGGAFEADNGDNGLATSTGHRFKVPRRRGGPCLGCGTATASIRVGGRGTYFCPTCQVLA